MNTVFPNKARILAVTIAARMLVLVLVVLAYVVSPFIALAYSNHLTSSNSAKAVPGNNLAGTWKGQGRGAPLFGTFDMTLTIPPFTGNAFSGTLTEKIYNSTVNVQGTINDGTLTFTDPSRKSGELIDLNTTYTGTVSNRTIIGEWVFADQSARGPISLKKQRSNKPSSAPPNTVRA